MSKATLEFDLPEDSTEFKWAIDGFKYWGLLTDIDLELRNWLKHDACPYKTVEEVLCHIRKMICEIDMEVE